MVNLIKGDITTLNVEAIVNAANNKLRMGDGVCGAIFAKANGDDNRLSTYCNNIKLVLAKSSDDDKTVRCHTGNATITPAFNLKIINPSINYIVHAVGPIYKDGSYNEDMLLEMAYVSSVKQAVSCGIKSIAFPFISSGIYGYPIEQCAKIAMNTLKTLDQNHNIDITMCAFSDKDYSILNTFK